MNFLTKPKRTEAEKQEREDGVAGVKSFGGTPAFVPLHEGVPRSGGGGFLKLLFHYAGVGLSLQVLAPKLAAGFPLYP